MSQRKIFLHAAAQLVERGPISWLRTSGSKYSDDVIRRTSTSCDASRPVAFMHVPKTSGSALANGLISALSPRRRLLCYDQVLFGSFTDFQTISAEIRSIIFPDAALMPEDSDYVGGHISFVTLRSRYPEAQLVTFLREPRSRVLSHWLYGRSHTDNMLANWGDWGNIVRKFRLPLSDFLKCHDVASMIDNVTLRMLIFPHPLVPSADFIQERNDQILIEEALGRLKEFSHVDYVENQQLLQNLINWLGCPFNYPRINETSEVPKELKNALDRELTCEAYELLNARSRLDLHLWKSVVAERSSFGDHAPSSEHILLKNMARYTRMMT
jgi:hypothetical protein